MIEKTKSINKVLVKNKKIQDRLVIVTYLTRLIDGVFKDFVNKINDKSERWIDVHNKGYYYIPSDRLLIVNPKQFRLKSTEFVKPKDLDWCGMKEWVIKKWFIQNKQNNPIINKQNTIDYVSSNGNKYQCSYIFCDDLKKTFDFSGNTKAWGVTDSDSIKIPMYSLKEYERYNLVKFFVEHDLNIFKEENARTIFDLLITLQKKGFFEYSKDGYGFNIDNDDDYELVLNECENCGVLNDLDEDKVWESISADSYVVPDFIKKMIIEDLLCCDEKRINMEKYPSEVLESPESGHWELWDDCTEGQYVYFQDSVVARNPVYDALNNKSGVIGIDFGTKSTVVTYRQSRADILPMRIGSGRHSREASQNDYENPTVMELRDVKSFLADYLRCEGRPYTKWENLLISHEAAEQLKSEQGSGDTFATFFCELKQWSSDKTRQVTLRDSKGVEVNIPSYLQLDDEDFDPIEIYAYYLGLFINNMLHKIYLRYKLSFPATVEKNVRDKLLASFTKGIKKSLPQQVIDNDECMKLFKVEQGASEPAAYAISALQEYGFDPEDGEKFYYGIFDFGGGTTDFDFGVWSGEEKEPENYDYQISHFGQGGDPYLGGENLLAYMAYSVFIENYNKLLKDSIIFIRPYGEKDVAGKDWLIKQDSQYAQYNHKRLKEKLRGVWEKQDECIESIKSGTIELPLFNQDGELLQNYSLEVNLANLDKLIEERIESGIIQFFSALKNCFGVEKIQQDIFDVDEINIFLAGNSSKSPVVMDLFKKHIDTLNTALSEHSGDNKNWINIYPPLGTDVADAVIDGKIKPVVNEIIEYSNKSINDKLSEEEEEMISDFKLERIQRPTGKTGVAFGLLNNRVRVIQNETEEISFRYYIGQNRKNKFFCVIDKDKTKYGEWVRFCMATREEFDIWFTRSADAPTNKLPIDQMGIYSEVGFVDSPTDEQNVYIRLVNPTDIEYVVASESEIRNNEYLNSEIVVISLQEKL